VELFFEILIQFLLEVGAQLGIELLAEIGIRSTSKKTGAGRPKNSLLAVFGYILLAAFCGGISMWIYPHHLIQNPTLNAASLILVPLVVGFVMGLRGKYLVRKGKLAIRLDSFSYGFLFALVFGLVRFSLVR